MLQTYDTAVPTMTVLVVEDDAAMRALLRDVLERAGHGVIALADGSDVPAVAERESFDVAIVDRQMPGSDGLDVLSLLRERRPAVPVVLVTAFGGMRVAEEARRRGAFSYLEKPFHIAAILDVVAAMSQFRLAADGDVGR